MEQTKKYIYDRFSYLLEAHERSEQRLEKIQALFSLLEDEYGSGLDDLKTGLDELRDEVTSLDEDVDKMESKLSGLVQDDEFRRVERVVMNADFPILETREGFLRRLFS